MCLRFMIAVLGRTAVPGAACSSDDPSAVKRR